MVDLRVNEGKTSPALPVNEAARDNRGRCMPAFSHTLPLELCPSIPLLFNLLHTHQSQTENLLRHCPTNALLSSTSGHNTAAFQFWGWTTTIGSKTLTAFQ